MITLKCIYFLCGKESLINETFVNLFLKENVLPKNTVTNDSNNFPIYKIKSNNQEEPKEIKLKKESQLLYQSHQNHHPSVLGPSDEIIPIGIGMMDNNEKDAKKKSDDLVYRLYEEGIPPYLYYTYKLDKNGYLSYEEMNAQLHTG